jgi:hypothetical protein
VEDATWITIAHYSDPLHYAVHVARLTHDGILHRITHVMVPQGRRMHPQYLLQVLNRDAVEVCERMGFPPPYLEPELPLTGLGLRLHQLARSLNPGSHGSKYSRRTVVLFVVLALLGAILLLA